MTPPDPAPRQRTGRRRTHHARTRRRRIARRTLGVAALLVVLTGVVLAAEAVAARNALQAAGSSLEDARAALGAGDLERAGDRVDSARVSADRAHARTTGPHWWIVANLPVVGDTPRTVRGIVEVVRAALDVTDDGLVLARDLLGDGTSLPLRSEGGRIELAPLQDAAASLAVFPVDRLADASDRLAGLPEHNLPAAVRAGRTATLDAADELLATLERARLAAEVLPEVLGADGPREYLLVVQNPAELRGTGGLIGFLGVLGVDDGAVTLSEPEGLDPTAAFGDRDIAYRGRFDRVATSDVPQPDDFADRYEHIAAGRFLPSTNADPDLPTVAPIVLDIYEQATNEALDGVITIDPIGLERIYRAIGPLDVPNIAAVLAPGLPDPIPPERIARTLLVDAYDALGGPTVQRRTYQTLVAGAALQGFLGTSWDGSAVGSAIGQALAGRNLQIVTTDPGELDALVELGVAGELAPVRDGDDLLAITANNAAGTKSDVHVTHRLTASVELGEPMRRDGRVVIDRRLTARTEVDNAIDLASDDYITRTLRPQRIGASSTADPRPGLVRTWFSQWLPPDAEVVSVRTGAGEPTGFSTGELHGMRIVDHHLETPHATTTAFETVTDASVDAAWDGRELTYALTLWRQGKAIADHVDVTVHAPAGWVVTDAALDGGGQPAGLLGPEPDATVERISAQRDRDTVRITGAMAADARILVTFEPA